MVQTTSIRLRSTQTVHKFRTRKHVEQWLSRKWREKVFACTILCVCVKHNTTTYINYGRRRPTLLIRARMLDPLLPLIYNFILENASQCGACESGDLVRQSLRDHFLSLERCLGHYTTTSKYGSRPALCQDSMRYL